MPIGGADVYFRVSAEWLDVDPPGADSWSRFSSGGRFMTSPEDHGPPHGPLLKSSSVQSTAETQQEVRAGNLLTGPKTKSLHAVPKHSESTAVTHDSASSPQTFTEAAQPFFSPSLQSLSQLHRKKQIKKEKIHFRPFNLNRTEKFLSIVRVHAGARVCTASEPQWSGDSLMSRCQLQLFMQLPGPQRLSGDQESDEKKRPNVYFLWICGFNWGQSSGIYCRQQPGPATVTVGSSQDLSLLL
ncbi:uncharacterized protein V6R79_026153 [Siganus canaliculatus]